MRTAAAIRAAAGRQNFYSVSARSRLFEGAGFPGCETLLARLRPDIRVARAGANPDEVIPETAPGGAAGPDRLDHCPVSLP